MRPDFDREGAWFTLGNIDLHLIQGKFSIILPPAPLIEIRYFYGPELYF